MADLVITAANVVPDDDAIVVDGALCGATITAGDSVYVDEADSNKIKLCDGNDAASSVCAGVALCGSSDGQPISYCTIGRVIIGAAVAVGIAYYVTDNAGGIGTWAEVQVASYATLVGIGVSTTKIEIAPLVTGAVKA